MKPLHHHRPELVSGETTTTFSSRFQYWKGIKPQKRKLLLSSSVLLFAAFAVIAAAISLSHRHSSSAIRTSHAVLHATCATTRFPELCRSAVLSASLVHTISSPKDVILASLNLTMSAVDLSLAHAHRLSAVSNLTLRERTALSDCHDMFTESRDELQRTVADLRPLPRGKKCSKTLATELEILVSAAMTNQESCLDGFSHGDQDRRLRKQLFSELTHVTRMCSNALAMIKDLSSYGGGGTRGGRGRKAMKFALQDVENGWPRWMKVEDKRRMTAEVVPDVVVAADGSGDYRKVSEAVEAAPANSKKRYVIRIKAGTYKENVEVPKKKKNLMFVGDGRKTTVITGSRNVVDGSTTFKSATLAVVGEGFLARGLRIENTAGPSKHQAVALRVGSDFSAFYDCDILGYQDTLYLHSLRQFFRSCLIQGTVDFIFGNAAAVLQDCDIQPRRPGPGQKNMITASGRDDPNEPTGIVLQSCRISATPDLAPVKGSFPTYLGRPWKEYARTVVMDSVVGDVVHPDGWHPWSGDFALDTLYYGEYRNTGAGAGTKDRVMWKGYKVITAESEAVQFTTGSFIGGSNWLLGTGFPFSLGL